MNWQVVGIICVLFFSGNFSFARPVCESGDLIGQALQIVRNLDKDCSLKVSEKVVLNESYDESPTSVRRRFTLKRTGLKSYEVVLNLKFQKHNGGSSGPAIASQIVNPAGESQKSAEEIFKESSDEEFQQFFQAKVKACLDSSAPLMKGPSGETLSFSLTNKVEESPVNVIKVTQGNNRDNASSYSIHTNCQTITHEILHLLGLVDEYEERGRGYVRDSRGGLVFLGETLSGPYAFDCRAIGPKNSIMNDQNQAFLDVKEGKLTSLLTPGQFRIITSPRCTEANATYLTCAKNAYETSVNNRGEGCLSSNEICNTNDGSWLK